MPIDEWINVFSYLVCNVSQVSEGNISVSEPLRTRFEGVARLEQNFCLRKQEAPAKPTFTSMHVQAFNEDAS